MSLFLGIDSGSVSTKAAAIDQNGQLLTWSYLRTDGKPLQRAKQVAEEVLASLPQGSQISALCATGSGRKLLIRELAPWLKTLKLTMSSTIFDKNEITCQSLAAVYFMPDVGTVLEIGGQDSKIIFLDNGLPTDFAMNAVCAAGTGSFLDHQIARLGIDMTAFTDLCAQSQKPCTIDTRCTVFAESAMISAQQSGVALSDILNGLAYSLADNFIHNVGTSKKLRAPYLFQGGVAQNKAIVQALEHKLDTTITVYPHPQISGAIGAALCARQQQA